MSVIDIVLCMILVVFLGLKLKSVYGENNGEKRIQGS